MSLPYKPTIAWSKLFVSADIKGSFLWFMNFCDDCFWLRGYIPISHVHITTIQVSSALHPSGVCESSNGLPSQGYCVVVVKMLDLTSKDHEFDLTLIAVMLLSNAYYLDW